jgi:hypothetical protein
MDRRAFVSSTLTVAGAVAICGPSRAFAQPGWTPLFDGSHVNNFDPVGTANWRLTEGGVLQADIGSGFLVTKIDYADFQLRAEFWVDATANSGIFIRCTDPKVITAANGYEVNIYDTRPDQSYATGAIVNVAKVSQPYKTGNQWNVMEITAKGPEFTVLVNGVKTVDGAKDAKHAKGRIALQFGGGIVRFRKVDIRPL